MTDNNGLLFYKKNYNRITGDAMNSIRINLKIESSRILPIEFSATTNSFDLETTYPGLLLGTGYTHFAKADNDAFKIGFFFDHTTGMPIIPGSSLKGVLRSVFPQFGKEDVRRIGMGESPTDDNSIVKAKWMYQLIEELKKENFISTNFLANYYPPDENFSDFKSIHDLEMELFDTAKNVFYDVIPVRINGNNIGNSAKLFANDYITPHENPLQNPEPLKFLKVLPKVIYQFHFKLNISFKEPCLNKEKLEILFKKILLTIGIGAKTNVGYGQFK